MGFIRKSSPPILRARNCFSRFSSVDKNTIGTHLLSDWGFYTTALSNLKRIRASLRRFSALSDSDMKIVSDRLRELTEFLESSQKTLGWKLRSLIGRRLTWYNEVDEWDVIESPPKSPKNSTEQG